jgi:hypothetical protein
MYVGMGQFYAEQRTRLLEGPARQGQPVYAAQRVRTLRGLGLATPSIWDIIAQTPPVIPPPSQSELERLAREAAEQARREQEAAAKRAAEQLAQIYSTIPLPATRLAETPWMEQEFIPGVSNKWLVYGAGAVAALAILGARKRKR